MALQTKQVHALAATIGLLEARIEIERIQGIEAQVRPGLTAAEACYRGLHTAFPALAHLFDAQHLDGPTAWADLQTAEPCS